ncbi:hypothetical protein J3F83DRAFT_730672 [Trichoderma novae-zelandiae]
MTSTGCRLRHRATLRLYTQRTSAQLRLIPTRNRAMSVTESLSSSRHRPPPDRLRKVLYVRVAANRRRNGGLAWSPGPWPISRSTRPCTPWRASTMAPGEMRCWSSLAHPPSPCLPRSIHPTTIHAPLDPCGRRVWPKEAAWRPLGLGLCPSLCLTSEKFSASHFVGRPSIKHEAIPVFLRAVLDGWTPPGNHLLVLRLGFLTFSLVFSSPFNP